MDDVIKLVKESWSKDLIIRYLYIKLAPYFRRDVLYFLASAEERKHQYEQGFINRFPDIVCSTLCDYYVELFAQFGIYAKKIIANSAIIPLFALVVEGELGLYFLDPLSDLFFNQYHLRPYFFGVIPRYKTVRSMDIKLASLSDCYVDELDRELDNIFLDDYFSSLKKKLIENKNAKIFFDLPADAEVDLRILKLQFYNDRLINLGNVNGPFERAQLYKFLNTKIFNKGERRFTKVMLIGELEDPHVLFHLISKDENLFYEEKKINDKYVLVKSLQ